ncbi:EamA family transporter [bacterium]|nr:MAG: EamA family transporter [bacterium]
MWKWYALGSAFFAALTAILGKIGIQGVPSNLGTAIRTIVILVLAWGLVFARGENMAIPNISRSTWIFLILSGIATGLSWLCYFRALQDGPAKYVTPIDKLSLPLTIVLAALILKEDWTLSTTIGVALVCIGTYVLILPK